VIQEKQILRIMAFFLPVLPKFQGTMQDELRVSGEGDFHSLPMPKMDLQRLAESTTAADANTRKHLESTDVVVPKKSEVPPSL
jgi:hypothetical protein